MSVGAGSSSAPGQKDSPLSDPEWIDIDEPMREPGDRGMLGSLPILITGLIVAIIALVVLLTFETRRDASQAELVERSSKPMALAQQVSIDANNPATGEQGAFVALEEAGKAFDAIVESLRHGDPRSNMAAFPEGQRQLLDPVSARWGDIKAAVDTILRYREALSSTRDQVRLINEIAPLLLVRSDEVVDAVIAESGDVHAVNEVARQRGPRSTNCWTRSAAWPTAT